MMKLMHMLGIGRLILGLLVLALAGTPLAWSTAPPAASHYLQEALIGGKQVQRWNDTNPTLNVYLQADTSIPGWHPSLIPLVKDAFSEWQQALNNRIRFVYTTDFNQSDIVVKWEAKAKGLQVGHQNIQWTDNTLTDADIHIALSNPQGRRLNELELKYVALHEIGHVLGIRGHSSDPADVMYATLQPKQARLSPRDITTIRALYQQKPDITNPTGVHLGQYRHYQYYIRLAYDAHKQKNHQDAYQYFRKAQSHYPHDIHMPYYIGMSAYNIKDYTIAIENLKKAAAQDTPNQASAQLYLAHALVAQGSDDIVAGRKEIGIEKLHQAKTYYDLVLNNPDAPQAVRKMATRSLNKLDIAATQYR